MAVSRVLKAAEPGMHRESAASKLRLRTRLRTRPSASVLFLVSLLGALLFAWPASPAMATSSFAAQTGKECTYCHVTPGGPLTVEGQAFHDAGDRLPAGSSTSTSPPGSATGEASDSGGTAVGGPLLRLPNWLHDLLVWAHLVAMTTWLGAIVFVHVVQTPRIAGQGIPRGYLRLAWPAIGTLGFSGVILTLGAIDSFSVLTSSRWGGLLLAKIALYLLLASVATLATFVVSPRLRQLAEGSESGSEHQVHQAVGRVTVGYQGKVYDLSSSRLWKNGRHARRHEGWRDLTAAMGGAPHGPEVFEGFPELSGAEPRTPRPVKAFVLLAYGNLLLVFGVLLIVAVW